MTPPEVPLVSRLFRVSGTNVDVAVAHDMLLSLGQATTQSPFKIELDPAERRPEPPTIGGQGMPTPPGYVGGSTPASPYCRASDPIPETPIPPSICGSCGGVLGCIGKLHGVLIYAHCRSCGEWAHNCSRPDTTPTPPPTITEDDVARWLKVPVETLRNTPRLVDGRWVDRIRQLLAQLDYIPCLSEDCDGIEDGEPATKHRPKPTRCHRCVAVRLAKGALDGKSE